MLAQASFRNLIAAAMIVASGAPAMAQAKLEAKYTATLAGLPIGQGNWTIDVGESQFSASARGKTTGLLRAFTGGEGTTATRGTINGAKVSSVYTATISTRKKNDDVRVVFNGGAVKELKIEPPPDKDDDRIPVTDAHKQNVIDPMAASIMRIAGHGDLLTPEACQRSVSVFDGRLRYDLQLAYKRMDKVEADKGYSGPVVVCAVYFTPIAGFIPSRSAIKYLTSQRDIEVWLAPIAGTRVLVPFRAQGPTPIGTAVLEADQFVAVATPTKAASGVPKTQ